jgi:hypothetical protein
MAEPAGWPAIGYYCGLHSYQRPRPGPDGAVVFANAEVEGFIRRSTSFVSPESALGMELMKAPGLVRDRPGAPRCATGVAVLNWLLESRKLEEPVARATAARMVQLGVLQPLEGGARGFSADKNALYRVVPPPNPAQPRAGAPH